MCSKAGTIRTAALNVSVIGTGPTWIGNGTLSGRLSFSTIVSRGSLTCVAAHVISASPRIPVTSDSTSVASPASYSKREPWWNDVTKPLAVTATLLREIWSS